MKRLSLKIMLPACLFVLVLGLKLDVIHRFGSDLPNWDQWDAEGLHLYVPWAEHRLGVENFFRPHNEHRIVLTKLLGCAELLINGQWDARLQCVVNALLHSSLAVLVFLAARRHLKPCWHPGCFALVALLFGLPLAWQNVLGGFHSQQYFLLGLSFSVIYLLPFAQPWSRNWWVAAVCGLLALYSMGSGLLAAAVVIPVMLLRAWQHRSGAPLAWPTLALCLGLVGLGWLGHVEVNYHESLKAHTWGDFVFYTLHSLQWPSPNHTWLALIFWAPLFALLGVVLRRRATPADSRFPLVILGLGAWVLLQILASAYARGAGADMPASRYVDTLATGALVNALALAWLAGHGSKTFRSLHTTLGLGWLVALGLGLYVQCRPIYMEALPEVRREMANCERNVRHYLATHDVAFLQGPDIPYPGTNSFRERIDQPALQAIMPVSVRRPLRLESSHPGPFRLNDTLPHPPKPGAQDIIAPPAAPETAGLSPATSPLEYARTWGSHGATVTGEWIGLAVNVPQRTYLHFQVTGQPGAPGVRLFGRDPTLGFALAQVELPAALRPDRWHSADVFATRGRLEFHARLENTTRWFAFSEPVEMAPLSYWARQLVTCGHFLWPIAAGLAVLFWILEWQLPRRG